MYKYRNVFVILLLFLTISNYVLSQENEIETQVLNGSNSLQFPYNKILKAKEINGKKLVILLDSSNYSTGDLFKTQRMLKSVSEFVEIVYTVNEVSRLPLSKARNIPAGTNTYLSLLNEDDQRAFIKLIPDNIQTGEILISAGSGKKIVSSIFLKNLLKACISANLRFKIRGNFLSLYHLDFLESDLTLETVLSKDFPIVAIHYSIDTDLTDFIKKVSEIYTQTSVVDKTDTHYSVFSFFKRFFIISEPVYVIIFILFLILSLLVLFGFSFTIGKKKQEHRNDFIKYWYLPILVFLIVYIIIFVSQKIVQGVYLNWRLTPSLATLFKLLLSCLFFSSTIQTLAVYKLPVTNFFYGYFQTLFALLNIFIFTFIDLPLFILFAIEYLIIYFSRMTKKTIFLLAYLLLMFLPFIPFVSALLKYGNLESITKFINTQPIGNILIVFLLMPFLFMFIRIYMSFGFQLFSKMKRNKSIFINIIVNSLLITITTFVMFFISHKAITSENVYYRETGIKYIKPVTDVLNISESVTKTLDRKLITIKLSSIYKVIRYDIKIRTLNGIAAYNATFPFTYTVDGSVIFNLDENPPEPLMFSYVADANKESTLEITAFYDINGILSEENIIYVIKHNLESK